MGDQPWSLLVGVVLGIGLTILWRVIPRLLLAAPIPRDMLKWQDAIETAAIDAVRTDLYAADAKRRLVELIGSIPKDFDPTVWLGCQIASGVHKAVLLEAERSGAVKTGTFETIYGVSIEEASQARFPVPHVEPELVAPPPVLEVEPVSQKSDLPNVVFINGQLTPRRLRLVGT